MTKPTRRPHQLASEREIGELSLDYYSRGATLAFAHAWLRLHDSDALLQVLEAVLAYVRWHTIESLRKLSRCPRGQARADF